MTEVTVTINNKNYGVSCDQGQEQRVTELGHYIDERLKTIASVGAQTTESHLLVLTCLVLADEIHDLLEGGGSASAPSESNGLSLEDEHALGNAVEHLNQRVIQIANRLKDAA